MEISYNNLPEAVSQLKIQVEELKVILLQQNQNPLSKEEQLLTVDECADFLKLKKSTIYKHVSNGTIPVLKRSKRIYFLKLDLIDYLKDGRKRSNHEIEDDAIQKLIDTRK